MNNYGVKWTGVQRESRNTLRTTTRARAHDEHSSFMSHGCGNGQAHHVSSGFQFQCIPSTDYTVRCDREGRSAHSCGDVRDGCEHCRAYGAVAPADTARASYYFDPASNSPPSPPPFATATAGSYLTCRSKPSPCSKTANRRPSRSSPTIVCRLGSACCSTSATACSASASSTRAPPSSGSCSSCSRPRMRAFVMTFNHMPHLLTTWTTPGEAATVRAALDTVRPSGGTAIYDAVMTALSLIDQRPRDRAALVLISDGADTASDTTLRDLRSALLRTDAFIFAVAIDSPVRQAINTRVNPEALCEITNQTGGHTEVVHDTRTGRRHGTNRRGTQHAVRDRLFVSTSGRRQVSQHPRPRESGGLQGSGAQRIRLGTGQEESLITDH